MQNRTKKTESKNPKIKTWSKKYTLVQYMKCAYGHNIRQMDYGLKDSRKVYYNLKDFRKVVF